MCCDGFINSKLVATGTSDRSVSRHPGRHARDLSARMMISEILNRKCRTNDKIFNFLVEATPECLPSAEEVKNDDCKKEVLNKIPDRMITDNKLSKRKRKQGRHVK